MSLRLAAIAVVLPFLASCVDTTTTTKDKSPAAKSADSKPEEARIANRPVVSGMLALTLRERKEINGKVAMVERQVEWKASETAIIVCDMWDDHYCKSAAQRVGVMAPRMNAVLTAARDHGVMIIHAPSGTVDMYADTPYRQRMKQAKA